jgi:hypothetical protein
MSPNWEAVSAIAAACTAVTAVGGIFFVWHQIRQVSVSLRSSTNERLMSESLEILRFLAEHPGNYDYFYNGKKPPEDADESLKYATEMLANYMEHVVQQRDTLPKDTRESWDGFVKDTYARSPVVRTHLASFKEWYDPRLHKLVEKVAPIDT